MRADKLGPIGALVVALALTCNDGRAEDPLLDGCRISQKCTVRGLCSEIEGQCAAVTDADCAGSDFCHHGKCHARDGRCVALTESDCQRALVCAEHGWCTLRDGACQPLVARQWESPETGGVGAALGVGIALTALGGGAIVGGFVALLRGIGEEMNCDEGGNVTCEEGSLHTAPALIGVGAGALGFGIPLTVIGARDDDGSPEQEVRIAIGVEANARTLSLAVIF